MFAMHRIIAAALVAASVCAAATNYRLTIAGGSKIWIEGTSSFLPYESRSTVFYLASPNEKMNSLSDGLIVDVSRITNMSLHIPVTNLRSETIGLDPYLYDTMRAQEHPNISFLLSGYDVVPSDESNRHAVRAVGTMRIAGKERPIALTAVAMVSNTIRVTGEKSLRMSDFGIVPPNLFFGLIICDDVIVVKWDLVLSAEQLMPVAVSTRTGKTDEISVRTEN